MTGDKKKRKLYRNSTGEGIGDDRRIRSGERSSEGRVGGGQVRGGLFLFARSVRRGKIRRSIFGGPLRFGWLWGPRRNEDSAPGSLRERAPKFPLMGQTGRCRCRTVGGRTLRQALRRGALARRWRICVGANTEDLELRRLYTARDQPCPFEVTENPHQVGEITLLLVKTRAPGSFSHAESSVHAVQPL